jgi:Asp-tRNA(Asn)/Glu-tRNA(Gln) amidotransferase A subunit family amidase
VKSPVWEQADAVTRDAFSELISTLGEQASEVELSSSFDRAIELHRIVMEVEMAHNLRRDHVQYGDRMSGQLRDLLDRGRGHKAVDYMVAVAGREQLNGILDEVFNEYDAILTPAAPGEAPSAETTGNPVFNTIWTYLGTPAVTLPLLQSESGLPIGVQLVGRRGYDARLLRTANSLMTMLGGGGRRRGGRKKS